MPDDFEAAGTMIEGGLLAKAVEDEGPAVLHFEGRFWRTLPLLVFTVISLFLFFAILLALGVLG